MMMREKKGQTPSANIVAQEGQGDMLNQTKTNNFDELIRVYTATAAAAEAQLWSRCCVCIDTRVASVKSLGTRMRNGTHKILLQLSLARSL